MGARVGGLHWVRVQQQWQPLKHNWNTAPDIAKTQRKWRFTSKRFVTSAAIPTVCRGSCSNSFMCTQRRLSPWVFLLCQCEAQRRILDVTGNVLL